MSEFINNENSENQQNNGQDGALSFRAILDLTWSLRYWIILSVFVALTAAAVYLHFQPKVYNSSMMVMVTNDKNAGIGSSAELSLLSNMTGTRSFNSLVNEQIIIKSTPVVQLAVNEMDLNIRYFVKHNLATKETMAQEVKMNFIANPTFNTNSLLYHKIEYNVIDSTSLAIHISYIDVLGDEFVAIPDTIVNFNTNIPLENCGNLNFTFRGNTLEQNNKEFTYINEGEHSITLCSPLARAKEISENITSSILNEKSGNGSSSILELSMLDNIASRAELVLEKVVEKYNENTKIYYSTSNNNTMNFIENRLSDLSVQLSNVEGKMKNFSINNDMVNLESQADMTLKSDKEVQDVIQEAEIQLHLLDMIKQDMAKDNEFTVIPSNIGISENSINSAINQYNQDCITRMRLISSSSLNNPVVQQLTQQLKEQKNLISKNIDNSIVTFNVRKKDAEKLLSRSRDYLQSIPGQKIDLQQINREQSIIEPLYVLLQQKREETMLAIVAEPDIARVIEHSADTATLISPVSKKIYAIAFILGFLLPIGIVYLITMMKTKIQTPEDVISRTRIPLVGVVPNHKKIAGMKPTELMRSSKQTAIGEIYRSIRTNIGFMKGKVFQVTSSVPGEGKSFTSMNLAISLAMIGKKVVLVESDLRKGHMARAFDLPRRNNNGLVNYLSGDISNWHDIVNKAVTCDTLDVIVKGTVPPNPNELLASDNMVTMIKEMREEYDYVILDSPPFLVIADPVTLNRLVDRNIYVMRAGVADLQFVDELNAASQNKKLAEPCIVLNGLQMDNKHSIYGSKYGYGYGYGYGYKYGYGYGYSSEEDTSNQRHGLRWFISHKIFKKS